MSENYDASIKQLIENATYSLVTTAVPEVNALGITGDPLPDVDIYDFASYVYLRKPELANTDNYGDYSAGLDQFLSQIYDIIVEVVLQEVIQYVVTSEMASIRNERAEMGASIWSGYVTEGSSTFFKFSAIYTDEYRAMIIEECYDLFLSHLAVELYELVVRVFIEHEYRVYEIFRQWLLTWIERYEDITVEFPIEDIISIWDGGYLQILNMLENQYPDTNYLTYIDNTIKYPFIPFREDEINFGLRLVYRQEWLKLGNQKGRLIKTIPLGPKQVEKVTVKTVTTQKVSQKLETMESTEQTRETEVTESNSSEIVSEAANSLNWNVGASASYSMGAGSVSMSAGIGGDMSSSSQDTKKSLNDSVEKSASKQKKETKVIVSTEREATDEFTRTSEISNPNEEIAITYVYNEMYQKFEVYTYLAELQSVIFIPEDIPHPIQIDSNWIKRYDWILRDALLDESFAADLERIISDIEEENILDQTDGGEDPFLKSFGESTTSMNSYKDFSGMMPDFFRSTGENYMKQLDKQRVIDNRKKLREIRNNRLFQHIRDNILHYMRAIWSREDPEQRMQRYLNIQVPTEWVFVPDEGSAYNGMTSAWSGEFVPNMDSARPLSEIVNPAGPIGWAVNYAIFYLKSDASTLNLNRALAKLRSYYVRYAVHATANNNLKYRAIAILDPHWNEATYTITYQTNQIKIVNQTPYVTYELDPDAILLSELGNKIEFEGIYVELETAISNGDQYDIFIQATGELQDPEENVKKVLYPLPPESNEVEFFDPIITEMIALFPELGSLVLGDSWDILTDVEKQYLRDYYHRFLMKQENTRKILIKSNNPMIDLEVGETPALEQFKRLHRAVDVISTLEDYTQKSYENTRKQLRMENQILSDPDIENVTVIGEETDLRNLVGASVSSARTTQPADTSPTSDSTSSGGGD